MAVLCTFSKLTIQDGEEFYCCEVKNQIIPENKELKLKENFLNVKVNNDVLAVRFSNCTVNKFPQGLTKIFLNLKVLDIMNSKLKKISKNDLAEYKNLERFYCSGNELEFLPGDLFEGFQKLEYICFSLNKLKDIEPNLLDGLPNLKHVNFKNNPKFNKLYSIHSSYNPNATLDEVKSQIFKNYYTNIENVKNLVEKYQQDIQKLKESEENLTKEIQQLKNSESNPSSDIDTEYKNLIHRLQTGIFGDLETFIHDESTKDFKIIISDREFAVHKFLLAARSPTLAEILRSNPEVENLNLVDISVEIFEKILKFLYTDELPREDGTNFLHLFAAAGKLKIEELKNFSACKLLDQLNEDNAFEILNQSNKYGIIELREKALDMIKKKYPKIDIKDDFAKEPEKVMKIIQNYVKREEAKRKYEEEIRKLDEQFENSMID